MKIDDGMRELAIDMVRRIDNARRSEARRMQRDLNIAVNRHCTCGGRGPDDDPCVACQIWHESGAAGWDE